MLRSHLSRPLSQLAAVAVVTAGLALPFLQSGSAAGAGALPVGSSGGATLVFADEFNGTTLNTSTWQTCSWWSSTTCSIESNNEMELYTRNNVTVSNGVLDLQARKETAVAWNGKTYGYTSGMVSSGGRSGQVAPGFTYKYGYAEARVKIPAGQGLWPAFWTLPSDYSWPPEIDAMEILGDTPNVTHMTYHYTDASGAQKGPGTSWTGADFSADWHVFGVDWQPDAIVWYVDGIERARFTDASAITAKPQYLLLNLAVGGNWPGPPSASTAFPTDYLVDYVRVWDRFGTAAPPTTPPPATGYGAVVAADGPASYWRLGETAGTTAADSVGTSPGTYMNGTTVGAASLVAADPTNRSASFDGVNDSVKVQSTPALSPTGAVSVEAWVRPSSVPASGSFASITTKAESYALQFNGPQLEFTTMQDGTRRRVQAPAGAVVAGQTYHVVGTYDGTTQRLFVNGSEVAKGSFSGLLSANTNPVVLGSWDSASEFAAATIDDVALYGKALTATQVSSHFTNGTGSATPPPPPPSGYQAAVTADGPKGYWGLGETSGTSAADIAGSDTGTYRNGVTLGATSLTSDTADRAATFDGVNDSVSLPSTSGLSPSTTVTVEAWVRPAALPAAGSFASIVAKAESYALQFNGNRLEFTTMANGTRRRAQAPAGAVLAGQTYHVVGTFDGTTQRLFVNGSLVAAVSISGPMGVNTNRIGVGSWDTSSEYLRGTIDDVAVYSKVLTAAQVANHYNQGRAA